MNSEFPNQARDTRSIVILTSIDGTLRQSSEGSCASLRESVAELRACNVPVVLTSHHSRAEVEAMQGELGVSDPFIAENGKVLCVPRGYFGRLPSLSTAPGRFETIEFDQPSIEDAVDMLMWLYRLGGDSPLLIGVGASWSDHLLLRHVDVPVVVRNPTVDQRALRAQFPEAFLTSSSGPAGWVEAMLGARAPSAEGRRANR